MSLLNLPVRAWLRVALSAAAPLVLFAMAGCDSSSRVETYVPTRIMSFGDELSTIKPDGSKYTVNEPSTTAEACTIRPVWNQILATNFGLAFPECKPSGIAVATGVMAAAAGANISAVRSQVAARPSTDFVPSTLVTIQAGMWDVLEAYDGYKNAADRSPAYALMVTRANEMAALISQIIRNGEGARVLFATVPDLGLSPYAIQEQAGGTCGAAVSGCTAFLSDLVKWFNDIVRIGIVDNGSAVIYGTGVLPKDDGRFYARVLFDVWTQTLVSPPRDSNGNLKINYGLTNVAAAACTSAARGVDISGCNTATLVTDATASTYLWAGDLQPGAVWHAQAGTEAVRFARNNPF